VTTPEPDALSFHLALYTDSAELGGAEVVIGRVLAALPAGIRVTVVGVDESVVMWLRERRPGTASMVLPPIRDRRDVLEMARHRAMFVRLAPDVVQFNLSTGGSCQWAILAAATVPGVPMVVLEHSPMGVWSEFSRRLKRRTSRRLAAHVTVGERTARTIESDNGLVPGSIRTIHHGVPDVDHAPVERPDAPTVLCVSRHDPVKGIDVLLDAFARVAEPTRLVVIGDGTETASLEAQLRRLGLEQRVELRPGMWGEVRAADVMWAFDALVLPSRLEGFPVTVVEAMLAAIPVVATRVGSVDESVLDGETGWIVPPEDPAALAGAIEAVVADPERARRMGARGREVALERFTLEVTVAEWLSLYRQVLGDRSLDGSTS
jgi:glycosyltransferase involved in cell wall biosynthesis